MKRGYVYLGDRLTDPALVGRHCVAVHRADGKCVCGRSSMLVRFDGEESPRVVLRRRLRKAPEIHGVDAAPAAKVCGYCERTYSRPRRQSLRRWLARKYCSIRCVGLGRPNRAGEYIKPNDHDWLNAQFWKRVERSGECWLFTGGHHSNGYGSVQRDGKRMRAHRLAYELSCGPIPAGKSVLHRCDTPLCINPEHLFLGTQRDNVHDMIAKGRHGAQRKNTRRAANGQ